MQKYQIGSDTSKSAQIITGLSEVQSCLRQFEIVIFGPKGPKKDPLEAKKTKWEKKQLR